MCAVKPQLRECVCIYTAVYSQTLTAISIFKYVNIVCIIQVHMWSSLLFSLSNTITSYGDRHPEGRTTGILREPMVRSCGDAPPWRVRPGRRAVGRNSKPPQGGLGTPCGRTHGSISFCIRSTVYLNYTYYVNILEDAYVCTWIIHTILTYLKMLMAVRVWLYTAV